MRDVGGGTGFRPDQMNDLSDRKGEPVERAQQPQDDDQPGGPADEALGEQHRPEIGMETVFDDGLGVDLARTPGCFRGVLDDVSQHGMRKGRIAIVRAAEILLESAVARAQPEVRRDAEDERGECRCQDRKTRGIDERQPRKHGVGHVYLPLARIIVVCHLRIARTGWAI